MSQHQIEIRRHAPWSMNEFLLILDDRPGSLADCCEALGSKWDNVNVGNFGIMSSFSFYFSHHMTTMEGGLIACSKLDVAEQMKILRSHGWLRYADQIGYSLSDCDLDPRYTFSNWGFNLRPTEIQASFGLHQLIKLKEFNRRRDKLAAIFFKYIDDQEFLQRPMVDEKAIPSWFCLPLMIEQESSFTRKDLIEHLEINGVATRPIVAGNLARHPVAEYFPEFQEYEFKGADLIHSQGMYIGLTPFTEEYEIDKLINIFEDFLTKHK